MLYLFLLSATASHLNIHTANSIYNACASSCSVFVGVCVCVIFVLCICSPICRPLSAALTLQFSAVSIADTVAFRRSLINIKKCKTVTGFA